MWWTAPDPKPYPNPSPPGDFNTVSYAYTSSTDPVGAPNAGLAGALVVAGRGQLRVVQGEGAGGPRLLPQGVDELVPLYFQVCIGGGGQEISNANGW